MSSHPLCAVSTANWHACNDLLDTGLNMMQINDTASLQDAVTANAVSVGSAHAFVASTNGVITHTDSLLAPFVGKVDGATNLDNCVRISSNTVCLQVVYTPSGQPAMSFLYGNFTDARMRRDILGTIEGGLEAAGEVWLLLLLLVGH